MDYSVDGAPATPGLEVSREEQGVGPAAQLSDDEADRETDAIARVLDGVHVLDEVHRRVDDQEGDAEHELHDPLKVYSESG